jgi:hypothetical protein
MKKPDSSFGGARGEILYTASSQMSPRESQKQKKEKLIPLTHR